MVVAALGGRLGRSKKTENGHVPSPSQHLADHGSFLSLYLVAALVTGRLRFSAVFYDPPCVSSEVEVEMGPSRRWERGKKKERNQVPRATYRTEDKVKKRKNKGASSLTGITAGYLPHTVPPSTCSSGAQTDQNDTPAASK